MRKFLVDTNIIARHLESNNDCLNRAVDEGILVLHPLVHVELLAYNYDRRATWLDAVIRCDPKLMVSHNKVLQMITSFKMHNSGLGGIDIHLLASCAVHGLGIWSQDHSVRHKAVEMGVPVLAG